jgi:prepilin-type N-terminal cleavage/methylation domain-containing protein/prepilin-type processing-associated H-X9-DG protein
LQQIGVVVNSHHEHMLRERFNLPSHSRQRGFTLVELLVVLAVIALLISVRLPALARATDQTKRSQCASNLKQFALAMHIFANDNNDGLPTSSSAYWAWDVPGDVGTFVESTGSPWTVMYCPGTSPRFSDADNWNLYNYAVPGYRVLGYANTFSGSAAVSPADLNATLTPMPVQVSVGTYATPLASQRVLLADATMSFPGENNPAMRFSYHYIDIPGGYSLAHLSPHLVGRFPVGGNVGMLDGHVEWRKFAEMTSRTAASSNSPVFWW